MTPLTTAKVIRILDKRRLVLNVGREDGVERGDKFAIYTPTTQIVDPETKEELGLYRERKATVEAKIITDRFTIASPPSEYVWDPLASLVPGETISPALPVNERDINPLPTGSTVRVGDIAELVQHSPLTPVAESEETNEVAANGSDDDDNPATS